MSSSRTLTLIRSRKFNINNCNSLKNLTAIAYTHCQVQLIMQNTIEVKSIDEDRISVLGKEYYTKEYLEEMMRREYQRGKLEGQQVHVAQIEMCSNCA